MSRAELRPTEREVPGLDDPYFETASGEIISRRQWLDRSAEHSFHVWARCPCGWERPALSFNEAADAYDKHVRSAVGYPMRSLDDDEVRAHIEAKA